LRFDRFGVFADPGRSCVAPSERFLNCEFRRFVAVHLQAIDFRFSGKPRMTLQTPDV